MYKEQAVICATTLNNLNPDKVINMINRALSNYAKENDLKDALLVVSISKATDGEIGGAEPLRKAAAPPCHGFI